MELKRSMQRIVGECARLRPAFERFMTWWGKELLALLPRSLRERMQGRARKLHVDFDGATAVFTLREPHEDHRIAELPVGADVAARNATLGAIRAACGGRANEIALHLPASRALDRTLTLPLAAEKNLREVLAFEMDRHTPFKAEQVYYDFAVVGREAARQQVRVALTLVPRRDVDPLLAMLREQRLEPTALRVVAADGSRVPDTESNLLPLEQRAVRRAYARGWPDRALASLALFLLSTAVALPFVQKISAVAALEREVDLARQEALAADAVRKALEGLIAEEKRIIERQKERPSVLQIVDELARVLPDSTWLNRLELAAGRVRLRGESADASGLATLIEHSRLLKDASFDATVTRDGKSEQERFALSATAVATEAP
jgi:general secretion pathway protein L